MKKTIFIVNCSLFIAAHGAAVAAYPVYQNAYGNGAAPVYQQPVQYGNQTGGYMPSAQVMQMPAAVQSTRVSGALPQVGRNNASVAGRQYYQPSTYDRLSDSGLYIGLSVGYAMTISGGMTADYTNEKDSFQAPGSFSQSAFKYDTVLPLQLSVGAAINSDVRVDFSYTRYSGINYNDVASTADGAGGLIDAQATGGAITSSATMLNLYYNIDGYTGNFSGGSLRPYIGVGLGIASNTIGDYVVYDGSFYPEVPDGTDSASIAGMLTAVSDIYAYHAGGTMEQLAYMLEGGVTTELEGGIKLDFFVRYMNAGKVQTSGSVVVSQQEWLATGYGTIGVDADAETPAGYDSVYHFVDWYESGRLGLVDAGIRMRIQF
jgi:hypothetical protein